MRHESSCIQARLDAQRCQSRIERVGTVFDSFRFSLPHPHDFCPSAADVRWIPEVRKAIIDGTDEEFQDCEADLRSRIPELSVSWLEERRKFFLQLLPQDSPSLEHLFLATTLFDCPHCRGSGLRIEGALSHSCYNYFYGREHRAGFANAASAGAFYNQAGNPWDSGIAKFQYSAELSVLVREVLIECGEDPDTITTQEMNRRHHRFACFGRDGAITVLNWSEAVSWGPFATRSRGLPASHCQFEHKRRYPRDVPCRLLRPDELPEYVPQPKEQMGGVWGCLHCWGAGESEARQWRCKWFIDIKDHLASS